MSGADISAVIVAIALLAAMLIVILAIRRKAGPGGGAIGGDSVTGDVVPGLMAELRKWQAETAYWKNQAERLQRELDERQ